MGNSIETIIMAWKFIASIVGSIRKLFKKKSKGISIDISNSGTNISIITPTEVEGDDNKIVNIVQVQIYVNDIGRRNPEQNNIERRSQIQNTDDYNRRNERGKNNE